MSGRDTVLRFVSLILEHKGTRKQIRARLRGLTDDEKNVLLDLVRLAGFIPDELVTGKAIGTLIEEGESREFLINSVCPFKVVDKRKETLYAATGFLNCAIWIVGAPKVLRRKSRAELVSYIESVVRDSVPFEPIKLSQENDYLICFTTYRRTLLTPPCFVRRPKDNDTMSSFIVGVHLECCGVVYREVGKISCGKCGLEVFVPLDVVTYGDLRRYLLSVAA